MQTSLHALIIDDESDILDLLEITLGRMGILSHRATTVQEAKELLKKNAYQVCLTDLKLPDQDGLILLKHIQKHSPHLPVVIITAHGSIDTALQALREGAFDFVQKPIELDSFRSLIQSAVKLSIHAVSDPLKAIRPLLGQATSIQKLKQRITQVARSQAPICIWGPSGSGKELVARLIHETSSRRDKPFVAINCAAIPSELMESEFFGHKRGSFTGAHEDKAGIFQAAHDGTLFLDEINELPLSMQVKLLRAIQEKSIRPIGATEEQRVDVRIVSAAQFNLKSLVKQGKFREDLYYRIHVIELQTPALREHPDDIRILANHIIQEHAKNNQLGSLLLEESALQALEKYEFPGNVRELENILERAVTLCNKKSITLEDLQLDSKFEANLDPKIVSDSKQVSVEPNAVGSTSRSDLEIRSSVNTTRSFSSDVSKTPEAVHYRWGQDQLDKYLENVERDLIRKALEQAKGRKSEAAKLLGISFRALRYRLKKLKM